MQTRQVLRTRSVGFGGSPPCSTAEAWDRRPSAICEDLFLVFKALAAKAKLFWAPFRASVIVENESRKSTILNIVKDKMFFFADLTLAAVSVWWEMNGQNLPIVGLDVAPKAGMEVRIRQEGRSIGYNWLPFDAVGKIFSVLNSGKACEVR